MKIVHLLSGPDVALSNQEQQFAKKYNHVFILDLHNLTKMLKMILNVEVLWFL